MIRVGLAYSFRLMWRGGINYYNNLIRCYQQNPDPEIEVIVLTDRRDELAKCQSVGIEIHQCPELQLDGVWNGPRRKLRHALRRHYGYDPMLLKAMKRHAVDLISHISIGRQKTINTLPWWPDFQHKALPHLFSAEECMMRDSEISNSATWGQILLSSEAAARDFRTYYPELASVKTNILHFASSAALDVIPKSRAELGLQYPVAEPYFFLPNQFWKHKNHEVVISALLESRAEIRVICSGAMSDRRDVGYVPGLMKRVSEKGLSDRFVCLGEVPYDVVVSLMHHSMAVLQPSLFEGWSTSVEESKALCKRIILSNIDVHREQAPERGFYFSPQSAEELAQAMEQAYRDFDPAVEEQAYSRRQPCSLVAKRHFSAEYARIIRRVCDQAETPN